MTDDEKLTELEGRLRAVESSSSRSEVSTNWYRNPDGPEAADAIHTLRQRNARLVEGLGGLLRLFLPIDMQIAQAEMVEQPVDQNAVLFCFMGSGASDYVTVGEYLAATASARTLIEVNSNG